MKKDKKTFGALQTRAPKLGRLSLLVGALVATGVLPPLSLPEATAAVLPPLPMPCGGCGNFAGTTTPIPFQQLQVGQQPVTLSSTSSTNLTINQPTQVAILNWQQFNISKGYSVNFVQPSTTASALNRIWDANPSTIAGSLTANGQIFLINQNGIVFASGAQVNTGALIASSLSIDPALYEKGYLVNDSKPGIFSAPMFSCAAGANCGSVRVDTGATLDGSRIMLFAPVVQNNGKIVSHDGQVILAAGHTVYLEASQDPNLRGLLVEVDVTAPVAGGAGTVTNTGAGVIEANRGNVTLVGFAVNQQGRISATTSVNQNGSIKLLARHWIDTAASAVQNQYLSNKTSSIIYDIRATKTGVVSLAKGSVTEVKAETAESTTTTDGQTFNPSIVEVMGKTVNVQGSIIAPGGKVNLVAVGSIDTTVMTGQSGLGIYQEINPDLTYSSFLNPKYRPVAAAGGARVFLDNGSLIDVSGSTATVSVARNILAVQLRGSQMADAPLQKNGFLWGKTVAIDIRKGSTLANITGDEAQIGRTVAERTAAGGEVKLISTGDVVMNPTAKIDISGGQVKYTGANINTTTLVSNGVVYDIANASPNQRYDAVSGTYSITHNKWGITETFTTMAGGDIRGRWDAGYTEGKAAGSVTILAPAAAIQGQIVANTIAGINQRQLYVAPEIDPATNKEKVRSYKDTWQMRAKGGTLTIGYGAAMANVNSGQYDYVTSSDVVVQANAPQTNYAVADVLAATTPITLDVNLFSSNLSNLNVYTNSIAKIAAGTSFTLAPGGSLKLQGGQVDMLGSVSINGGSVSLTTVKTIKPAYNLAGAINVGGNITTRGTWVNDSAFFGEPDTSKVIVKNGGNISIDAGDILNVASGLVFDASAGAWVDQSGKVYGGNGGNIRVSGGTLQSLPGTTTTLQATLDSLTLRSYGVDSGKGGSLNLGLGRVDVQVGGVAPNATTLLLSAGFFQSGGFSSYTVGTSGNLSVDGLIQPKAQSLILKRDAAYKASGMDVYAVSDAGFQPDWQRKSVDITFSSANNLTIGNNAQIVVDPKASITLGASNQLTVLGTLSAPAGAINLNLTASATSYAPTQSIWLGSQSRLLSQGYFMQAQPNAQSLMQGQVLSGGKINININDSANVGYVVAQQGSLMDVSGASADIDLPQLQAGSLIYRTSHVAGDAGSINVRTNLGAVFDGSMKAGVEAGSQAAAGSFSLTLDNSPGVGDSLLAAQGFPAIPAQIQLMASGNGSFAAQAGVTPGNDANAGSVLLTGIAGRALLDATVLQSAGFDQVKLRSGNAIVLGNQVNLQTRRGITLDALELIVNGNNTLSSSQVWLGNSGKLSQPNPTAGVAGTLNTLNVYGQLIDLQGNFTVSGANQINLNSKGDIRLSGISTGTALTGSLRTQGNITMTADQVYPTTLAQFKVSVEDNLGNPAGIITVLPGQHAPSPVMSAGGQLTLSAADIMQNGVLKAPNGTLNLNGSQNVILGAGSLTSVSGDGAIVPFGLIQGGNAWYYDLTGEGMLVSVAKPPQKILNLSGASVTVAKATATTPAAIVDISGGGDLYANEFFAGAGGTVNVLDPSKASANTFAIIPGMSGYSPYDAQAVGQYNVKDSVTKIPRTILQTGASVYLAGGAGIKAGYYTLLPASYALLPGAYRVTAVTGYPDRLPGQGVTTLLDGSQIMAGKFAVVDTNIQDARYSGFMVTPGSVVRTQSEYHDSYANAFFAAQAAATDSLVQKSPVDAGQFIVNATTTLQLAGIFKSQPGVGGKGAWVDLNVSGVGSGFDIVNTAGTGTVGLVELTTSALNNLGAESLLIGGVRSQTKSGSTITGTTISVGATNVVVNNSGATLSGAEIMLVAKNAVTVKAGSSVQGNGVYSSKPQNLTFGDALTSGDGALLRVSSSEQVTVTRNNSLGAIGTLTVENGATVSAQNSVLFDASFATSIGGAATLKGKALSVAANTIDIGNGTSGVNSLGLTSALLGQMQNFQDITLHSYNDINFFGAATLGGLDAQGKHLISNLALNAMSLNGVNNAGSTASIDAANVMLMNNNTAVRSAVPGGSGTLKISADKIVLGEGAKNKTIDKAKTIRGFDNVELNAAQTISGQDTGELILTSANVNAHTLVLQGTLTGVAKSDQTITATGYDTTIFAPTVASAANGDIGAKLAINAKSILDKGSIDLAAGSVSLHATGLAATDGVTLDSTSHTSAAGATKLIVGQTAYASAGAINLTSDNGNIDIKSGALVDVHGAAAGGDAGLINIVASKGTVTIATGTLLGTANASYAQGSFTLDANNLTTATINPLTGAVNNALTALNDTLTAGGFTQSRDMRLRTGNWVIEADALGAARAKAQTFRLAADAGNIDVFGTVDASGANGGNILLAAKNNVTLNAGALLDAHATDTAAGKGGKVALETTLGTIDLKNQRIDVHGAGNTGGSVLLRAPRTAANNDVLVNNTGGTALNVSAGANVTVEAFKTYTAATIGAADVAPTTTNLYYNDAATFATYANVVAIKNRLGMTASQHLTPGVEIDSVVSATNLAGDLTLTSDWDLSKWRFNDGTGTVGAATEAGVLTLRAAGDLVFGSAPTGTTAAPIYNTASLSDGFTSAAGFTLLPVGSSSWSYRLVGGSDATGANVLAVNDKRTGNVKLAPGGYSPAVIKCGFGSNASICKNPVVLTPAKTSFDMVRTGVGSIDLAAGGGLYLGNSNSMIYTAGQQVALPASLATNLTNKAVFTTGGGDVNIAVNGDISAVGKPDPLTGVYSGSAVSQLISDWLLRQGSTTLTNGAYATPPAWWVNFGAFAQNIGALGGGNVNITAGGNITSLSAVVPSTGYVAAPGTAATLMSGGNLSVKAGGDINSGIFYVGNGQGAINAGGALGSSRNDGTVSLFTILALGEGNIDVKTGGDLNLQTVLNPTMVGFGPLFFTYGDNSGVSLTSTNGNVLLSNNTSFYPTAAVTANAATSPYLNPSLAKAGALTVYPGTLSVAALNGSINSNSNSSAKMILFPSAKGNLQFLASGDINFTGFLTMSDVSPNGLQANSPVSAYSDTLSVGHGVATGTQLPLHSGDVTPVTIAAGGSVIGDNTASPIIPLLVLPKSVRVQAGADIKNLSMSVQNVQGSDTTSMTAGRDIVFTPNPLSTALNPSKTVGVTVTGAGQLVLQAGRNVDLGESPGLVTKGNLDNFYLSDQGASITVLAGVGQGATATQAFIDKYINPASSSIYGADLIAYVSNYGAPQNQTAAQAFSSFSTLSKPLQDAFARQVFFSELKSAGRSAASTGNYKAGYDAIATLFSNSGNKGNISLYSSQIKTERGGDINLLAPGGGVNAGLAIESTKKPKDLGIVTIKGGDVNAFVNNDFLVNQSRVFTLQGGNILMWSSYGNLDAGKGSKTVSSTPPPILIVDPKTGAFNVDVTQSVVGSGIRVLLASKDVVPGSVDLYAPAGEINAGDAGIGAAGNIFLGALLVRGADNINFGGSATGVPVAAPAPVSVGLGNLQDASKAANEATQSLASSSVNTNDFKPTFLSIEVIGLGDKDSGSDL